LKLTTQQIDEVLKDKRKGLLSNGDIEWVSTDSRSTQNHDKTIYFALIGKNHNGHDYISELIEKGVQYFVVQQIPAGLENKAVFWVVENTLSALHQLAIYYRSLFDFPVIAITGSNGKTIIKEWLNFLISPEYSIIRSPKSYNSQIGVPLSILLMNEFHNLGIFEAGISTVSEMENLEKIIQPNIGVLTNIGSAHDEGFENTNQKIKEKLKLFVHCDKIIFQRNENVEQTIREDYNFKAIECFTWGFLDDTANVNVITEQNNQNIRIYATYLNVQYDFVIPFIDEASIENAISCLCVLLHFNYDKNVIQERMSDLYPVNMRLQVKPAINRCTIIDDSYSADYQSLSIALDFLEHQKQHQKKTVILSDILQSGLSQENLYSKVFSLLNKNSIHRIIVVGSQIGIYSQNIQNVSFFTNTDELLKNIESLHLENETILIKGAREFQFEKIVKALEYKKHETVLEVNLNAISHNLNYFKSKLNSKTKIMVMIKAFGYGNGGYELAKLLEHHHVNYLGVAFADEGITLRNSGIKIPIMVMNPEISSYYSIVQNKLEPEIYNLRGLLSFLNVLKELNIKNFPIHLKLDTGMHRLGFEDDEIQKLINTIIDNSYIQVKSILSHLAASDEINLKDFTQNQIDLFDKMSSAIMKILPNKPIRHIANTSGISNFPQAQFDMVRLGIGLYGVSNDESEIKFLQNVSTLKTVISQIKTIKVNDSVGYGRKFIAKKTTKIATVPIGYADGISRALSNGKGYFNVMGKKAQIVGNVCMDMIMIDVTEVNCKEGDEVIVFGEEPSVVELAKILNTIPYEILTGISHRVKRIFYRD
jgi:alanine racemase